MISEFALESYLSISRQRFASYFGKVEVASAWSPILIYDRCSPQRNSIVQSRSLTDANWRLGQAGQGKMGRLPYNSIIMERDNQPSRYCGGVEEEKDGCERKCFDSLLLSVAMKATEGGEGGNWHTTPSYSLVGHNCVPHHLANRRGDIRVDFRSVHEWESNEKSYNHILKT